MNYEEYSFTSNWPTGTGLGRNKDGQFYTDGSSTLQNIKGSFLSQDKQVDGSLQGHPHGVHSPHNLCDFHTFLLVCLPPLPSQIFPLPNTQLKAPLSVPHQLSETNLAFTSSVPQDSYGQQNSLTLTGPHTDLQLLVTLYFNLTYP